jgi:fermentation-respiration switch protein FrsA (DUF1100 family)
VTGARRVVTSTLLVFVAVYLGIVALVWTFQSRLLYFPARGLITTPSAIGMPYTDVRFRASDGVRLHGWYIPAAEPGPGPQRGTVLFFHGNGGNISGWLPAIVPFRDLGFDTFLIDYRGYGESEGEPSEQGTYLDAEAAWRYLTGERGIAPERIVLAGRSLGGAVATWLAERHTPRALILESTFTSVPDLASELYPWLPVRLLVRFRYDTASRLRRVQAPVLIVHSRTDEIIPYHHGQRLFEAAREPKAFLEVQGGHNDGFQPAFHLYEQGIRSFLETHAPR